MAIIDFIDFDAITSVLGRNSTVRHLFLAVTDLQGNTLSSTEWARACRQFHRENPHSRQRCLQSDTVLANRLNAGEKYAIYTCFNGLTDAATPIVAEGERIGNLVAGQAFLKPPDMDFFARQATKLGFDREDYLRAIADIPVVEEGELRRVMDFYSDLTNMLVSMARQTARYKELSDSLARRTAELEYVNGELEAFSYSVSHDLRAPLRHIMGFIELFNRKFTDGLPEQGRHYFEVIHTSARSMSRLIDELLQFCRNGRTEMVRGDEDMGAIVAEVVRRFRKAPGRDIRWIIGTLPPARCDRAMLFIVWHNLIDNAVKFTWKVPQAQIEIGCMMDGAQQAYFIRDNGAGFDMKYAGKLFGVFQRMHTSDEFDGTGIGLATAKRIVSRHGGRIWAEAEPGKGATFAFTLPGKEDRT